ncbi:MAG: MRP family ATP-binding protein [Planctomycetes bacterium]|nr:MRP family ATP-binding protein [Planctomycetota bacterium]
MNSRTAKTDEILAVLKTIRLSAKDQDLVSAGKIRGLTHCDGAVKAELLLDGVAPAEQERALEATRKALKAIAWVTAANVSVAESAPATTPATGNPVGVRNIIAVASGKGGVGKSTIAVNLAAGLAAMGARTGLLDADIYGPSIPLMLGVRDAKPQPVEGPGGKQLFGPVSAHGVKLMSMGFLVEEDKPVIWRGPMLHGALRQFFSDVAWGELDYLIVDLPPGTGDVALTMVQTVQLAGVVIVSTPQQVAMLDARKALNMFSETGVSILGITENMSGAIFGCGGALRWAEEQGVTPLGSIPLDARMCASGDDGIPAVLSRDEAISGPLKRFVREVVSAVDRRNAEAPARKPLSIKR